jgi:molybdate transport system substrate-binding protein
MTGAIYNQQGHRINTFARTLTVMLVWIAVGVSACGGSGETPTVVVSAATSLQKAFTRYGGQFSQARLRFSFAGSDILAAQIEQGLRPDVFASANTKLPEMLYAKGLVDRPTVFAANKLVIAVPTSSTKITSFTDVTKPGITLSVGTAGVPVGAYTQTVLGNLPASERSVVLANVKDREPDVTGIVGKLTEGAVDAGFLYITDVSATDGQLKAIALPAGIEPRVAYGAAVVKGTAHSKQAQAFVKGLLEGDGRADLLAAGFLPPPSS